jgi:hypothetical protein
MAKSGTYAGYEGLEPFFAVIQEGLKGLVQGEHFFDTIAEDTLFEFLYDFPGWPRIIWGRAGLVDQFSGYGDKSLLAARTGSLWVAPRNRVVIRALMGCADPGCHKAPKRCPGADASRSRSSEF